MKDINQCHHNWEPYNTGDYFVISFCLKCGACKEECLADGEIRIFYKDKVKHETS